MPKTTVSTRLVTYKSCDWLLISHNVHFATEHVSCFIPLVLLAVGCRAVLLSNAVTDTTSKPLQEDSLSTEIVNISSLRFLTLCVYTLRANHISCYSACAQQLRAEHASARFVRTILCRPRNSRGAIVSCKRNERIVCCLWCVIVSSSCFFEVLVSDSESRIQRRVCMEERS